MTPANNPGYAGQILRVNLTTGTTGTEDLPPVKELRKYLGGTGLAAKILYDEVPPGVEPFDPGNRLIFATGPLGGTIGGTGTFSVVTKGPMTGGCLSSQANGFMGAYLKFSGFDAVIVQGAAQKPAYLYIHDGEAELRDAGNLKGKDTWECEDIITRELGKERRQLSIFSIGPAGENRVRFAAIVGDRGHVVAHGGPGAVMASKNLKAIVAQRGHKRPLVRDKKKLAAVFEVMLKEARKWPLDTFDWGTSNVFPRAESGAWLPVKNYLESDFPEKEKFTGPYYRPLFERKKDPCWGCRFNHCAILTVKEGPYAGYFGDEPEYECFATFGSLTGQKDPVAAMVLSNDLDRLGMDVNEVGWLLGWIIECYEKGLLTEKDTDGLKMTWGNIEAMRAMLHKIANREGIGHTLAEGAMRAARKIGGEAAELAIFTMKGNTPRGHDHRVMWHMILDVCTSDTTTDAAALALANPASQGLPVDTDTFSADGAAAMLAAGHGRMPLLDSLGICILTQNGVSRARSVEALNAVTGWDVDMNEARLFGGRVINLLRAFNIRHGLTPAMEAPSARYASAILKGPAKGKAFLPVWDRALRSYYRKMGWDEKTGRPLPETLRRFGLDFAIKDIW